MQKVYVSPLVYIIFFLDIVLTLLSLGVGMDDQMIEIHRHPKCLWSNSTNQLWAKNKSYMNISSFDQMTNLVTKKNHKLMILVMFLKFITRLSLKIIKYKAHLPYVLNFFMVI